MAMAAAIIKVIGGVAQMGGAISQGRSEAHMHDYTASIYEDDARIVRLQSAEEISRYRRAASRARGQNRTTQGASGLTTQGSYNEVMYDSFREEEMQVQNIKYNAEIKATRLEQKATIERASGVMARRAANSSAVSSGLDTASSVVGGGGFGGGS